MTVVVDPGGSPTIVFGDPSIAIYEVAAAGSNQSNATQLTRYSAHNVVTITADAAGEGVKLPAGQEGDAWEMYSITPNMSDPPNYPPYNIKVYDVGGTEINGGSARITYRYVGGAWRSMG